MKVHKDLTNELLFIRRHGEKFGLSRSRGYEPEDVVVLGISDPFILYYIPKEKRYRAGCRDFSAKGALRYWQGLVKDQSWKDCYYTDGAANRLRRAKKWVRLIEKNEAELKAEKAKRQTAKRKHRRSRK